MSDLKKRKKEFLKAYNNLCSCYGELVSEQTKVTCNILAEKVKLKQQLAIAEQRYAKAKWWLNEIVTNHRFTPISTAEKAIKDLEETERKDA